MKKLTFLFLATFFVTICFGQSATYQGLLALNHNEVNNSFNIFKKLTPEDFSSKQNIIWSNFYFRYTKGNIDNPQTAMKFSVINEQTYQLYFSELEPVSITFYKNEADKILDISVTLFELDNGKIKATKLKNKSFVVTKQPNTIKVEIGKEVTKIDSYITVNFETETQNLKQLGAYNFEKPTNKEYKMIMSGNIPRPFKYKIPTTLLLQDQVSKKMRLKKFTNSTPPIIDYAVDTDSYKWILNDKNVKDLVFDLESVFFGLNIGPSPQFIMSQK